MLFFGKKWTYVYGWTKIDLKILNFIFFNKKLLLSSVLSFELRGGNALSRQNFPARESSERRHEIIIILFFYHSRLLIERWTILFADSRRTFFVLVEVVLLLFAKHEISCRRYGILFVSIGPARLAPSFPSGYNTDGFLLSNPPNNGFMLLCLLFLRLCAVARLFFSYLYTYSYTLLPLGLTFPFPIRTGDFLPHWLESKIHRGYRESSNEHLQLVKTVFSDNFTIIEIWLKTNQIF